jgi:hypothetical protein
VGTDDGGRKWYESFGNDLGRGIGAQVRTEYQGIGIVGDVGGVAPICGMQLN